MFNRKNNQPLHYRNTLTRCFLFALISFSTFILLTCNSEKSTEKGDSSDFDISGQYYAGHYQYPDQNNQTAFYPNTYPKSTVRLEILQFYPNWREITVKLHARFYDEKISGGSHTWISKGRFLGMGTGTLTLGTTATDAGSYTVNFVVEDYFIDSEESPTTSAMKFTFNGKVSQFSTITSNIDTTPIYSNTFITLTGTMTIQDNNHEVFSINTTTKKFAAKRWRTETFQPF